MIVQGLMLRDFENRLNHCQEMSNKIPETSTFSVVTKKYTEFSLLAC